MNPNLQAVADGASARLIPSPGPHLGVGLTQTLPFYLHVDTMYHSGWVASENCSAAILCTQRTADVNRGTDEWWQKRPVDLIDTYKTRDSPLLRSDGHTQFQGLGGRRLNGCTRAHPSRLAACRLWLPTVAPWKSTFGRPTNFYRIQHSVARHDRLSPVISALPMLRFSQPRPAQFSSQKGRSWRSLLGPEH